MNNNRALVPITPRKARPRYGGRARELELPPWLAGIEQRQQSIQRAQNYKSWLKETYRRRREAEMAEKVKTIVAGVAFVVFSLATSVVR